MKIEFSGQIFEKILIFHKNPSSGSFSMRTDGRTFGHTDWKTDMTKLIVAFRNFLNATKNDEGVIDALSFVFYAIL